MNITYKEKKEYNENELRELFLSVEWSSGKYPERLKKAILNSDCVFSVYDDNKLIGLINVLDDSEMTAYVHYLLVNPQYQKCGIGRALVDLVKEKYKDFLTIVLVSYNYGVEFYKACGFKRGDGKVPMYFSDMEQ